MINDIDGTELHDGDTVDNLKIIKGNDYYDSPQYTVEAYVGYRLVPTKKGSVASDSAVFLGVLKHPVRITRA